MVWREVRQSKPKVIVLLGSTAVASVIGHKWRKDLGTVARWRGLAIPDKDFGCWIVTTYHPSYLLRNPQDKVLLKIFTDDLRLALDKIDKPLPKLTGILPNTKALHGGARIAYLKDMIKRKPSPVSFDYETTGLKPYEKGHKIVAVSFSEKATLGCSMLMDDTIAPYVCEILTDPDIHLIAANMKFEHTWSKVCLGVDPGPWDWDTMVAAHLEDNRAMYCALKFQAFVRFGIPPYDEQVEPYLKSRQQGGGAFNRILELPESRLLEYNAIDAALEWRLAQTQQGSA
jgi:hypothetical protein